jgi:steroid Delta-isomerase
MTESGTVTVDHLRSIVERYAAAHSAGDVDAVVALFAADAVVHDPVDAPPHVGRDAVRAFFASSHEHLDGLDLAITGPIRAVDRFAAVPLRATTTIGEDRWVIDIIDVFTFGDDGLVTEMRAYWTASDLRPAD